MTPDSQTNYLYLADTLPTYYVRFFREFEKLLKNLNVNFELLPFTKDVWAVDYMPIQIDKNRFVQFVYKPSYIKKKDLKYRSEANLICDEIELERTKSTILLDGGNVVRTKTKAIITDRIFVENTTIEPKQLQKEIQEILELEDLFIIPQYPDDFTGHADGLVRFLDDKTVLINSFTEKENEYKELFEETIRSYGLDFIRIPYNPFIDLNKYDYQANGLYINYLEMDGIIIIPTFGIKEDDIAKRQFEKIFPNYTVASLNCNKIANGGGVLNCITWNILK